METGQAHTWPGWQAVRCIGQGSYGSVYEIHRQTLGEVEKAALKVITVPQRSTEIQELRNDGYDEGSIRAHLDSCCNDIVREYAMMMKMKGHGNIVYCDDYRTLRHGDGLGWTIYIKMELLTPMSECMNEFSCVRDTISLGRDLCRALIACRDHSIVHRDIKPQNIFRGADGSYKLGDFGIAKTVERTAGGTRIGTYKYVAPEVFRGQPYGAQADIYSLGMVMYWMLNHRRIPFLPLPPAQITAAAEESARNRRLFGEPLPPPAEGGEELKRIVLRACAYDPAQRYASAEEMLADLNRLPLPVAASDVTAILYAGKTDPLAAPVLPPKQQNSLRQQESVSFEPEKKRSAYPWVLTAVVLLLLVVSAVLVVRLMDGTASGTKDRQSNVSGETVKTLPSESAGATDSDTVPQETASATRSPTVPEETVIATRSPTVPEETVIATQSPTVPEETGVVDDSLYENTVLTCSRWAASGDYLSAVKHLDQMMTECPEDPRYCELREEYLLLMQHSVMQQAHQLLEEGQFNGAISLLAQANADYSCPEYTELSDAIEEEYIRWYSTEGCTQVYLESTPRHIVDCMLSNFSEQHFWEWNDETNTANYTPFHVETATKSDLVTFAVRFAMRGQNHAFSPMRVDGTDYYAIPGSEFDFSPDRYMDVMISVQDAADCGYKTFGDYVCFPPFEPVKYCHFSVVDELWKRPDGNYVAFFRVYEVHGRHLNSEGSIDGYSIYKKTPEQVAADSDFSYHASGVAVLSPYKYAGDDNYQLVSYMLFAPGEYPVGG